MSDSTDHRSQKSRRCYHRVISGIERGGQLRFVTLTASKDSPADIQRSFRRLYMRLKRRGLIQGYIKVKEYTRAGRAHLHIIFRGSYIDQVLLSHMWSEIHFAPVVDIRQIRFKNSPRKIASYMAKYMCKENAGRYSWSWGWVWRGFCHDWAHLKRLFDHRFSCGYPYMNANLVTWWRLWLHGVWTPDFSMLTKAKHARR